MTDKTASASLVLGIIAVLAVLASVPVGHAVLVACVGLAAGISARRSSQKMIAVTGASLCGLVLLYFLVGFVLFALLP